MRSHHVKNARVAHLEAGLDEYSLALLCNALVCVLDVAAADSTAVIIAVGLGGCREQRFACRSTRLSQPASEARAQNRGACVPTVCEHRGEVKWRDIHTN